MDFKERDSNFSLNSPAIGLSNPGEPRSKIAPYCKGYGFCGVSTTPGGRDLLLLGLFLV